MATYDDILQAWAMAREQGNTEDAEKLAGIAASMPMAQQSGQEMRSSGAKPPSIVQGGNKDAAGMWATMRASLAPNDADKIAHYSAVMGIPKERFGILDGNIIYYDQQGAPKRVVPGVFDGPIGETPERLARYVMSQFGPSIPQVAGGLAGTATAPMGLASVPIAAGTAGAVDAGRQAISNALLDQDPLNIDVANVLGQSLQAGGAQGLGLLAAKALTNNPLGVNAADRVNAADPQRIANARALQAEARNRGVNLSTGQATDLASIKAQERVGAKWPETKDFVDDFIAAQRNQQVPAAVRGEIANISQVPSAEGPGRLREGSKAVVDYVQKIRASKAGPLYDEAFKANKSVASPEIDRILDTPAGRQALRLTAETMQNLRTKMGIPDKELNEQVAELVARGEMVKPKGGVAAGLKLQSLDLVKQRLDEMGRAAAREGKNLDAGAFSGLARDLRGELDRLDVTGIAGPNSTKAAGGAYARARALFAADSPAVETLKKGAVGKIASLEGDDSMTIVRSIFDKGRNPADVRKMKMAFQAAGRQGDWDAGIASFMSDKLDEAMKINAGGDRGNVPGKFFASLWGDERQKKIVQAALSQQQFDGMNKLMEVLNAASRSLPRGSQTAEDLGQMGVNISTGSRIAGKVFSPGKWLSLGDEVVEGVAALREPQKRVALMQTLLSGDFDRELSKLRMVSNESKQATALVTHILNGAGVIAARPAPRDRPALDTAPLQ